MPGIVEDAGRSRGRTPFPRSGTTHWLCSSLLTYRPGYCSWLGCRQSRAGQHHGKLFCTSPKHQNKGWETRIEPDARCSSKSLCLVLEALFLV